ncbi:MAG: pilus assembly protein PilX [Nitrospirota bacterium]
MKTTRKRQPTIRSEQGIALAMVLVLSTISLVIIAAMIYIVLQGTKSSAAFRRYATALEAGHGGAEIAVSLVDNRGRLLIPGLDIDFPNACICDADADPYDEIYPHPSPDTCLCRKLCMPPNRSDGSSNWNSGDCDDSPDPTVSPDLPPFKLAGFGTEYQVFAKIIDTTVGATDLSGENLSCGSGAAYECGSVQGPSTPYLYRIEIRAQDSTNPVEKSGLSVLYAY